MASSVLLDSPLRVGSVCSGAGGFDLGFHRAGFETRWVCEIGGTPCQDLSVAGKRAGIDGERSGLFWDYMRVRNGLNVPWCVWENVAGALSSNGGLDFASVLGAFVGADVDVPAGGWGGAGVVTGPWGGACWRLLDAQYFGVPQRRRRVFVVGHLGGPCPPEVLFESACGAGDSEARGEARPGVAGSVADGARTARTLTGGHRLDGETEDFVVTADVPREREIVGALDTQRGGPDDNSAQAGHLIHDVASTLQGGAGKRGYRIDAEGAAGGHLVPVD